MLRVSWAPTNKFYSVVIINPWFLLEHFQGHILTLILVEGAYIYWYATFMCCKSVFLISQSWEISNTLLIKINLAQLFLGFLF